MAELGLNDGTPLSVESTGSENYAAFDLSTTMPAMPQLENSSALEDLVQFMRNETDVVPELRWSAGDDLDTELKLYVGASKVVFRRVSFYQAIEHLIVDATLLDDGRFRLPGAFIGAGLTGSSMGLIYAVSLPSDSFSDPMHSTSSQHNESRYGKVAPTLGDTPPFKSHTPALTIGASTTQVHRYAGQTYLMDPVPQGHSELSRFRNRPTTILECVVSDPTLGEMVFPDDVLADLPLGPGDLNKSPSDGEPKNCCYLNPTRGISHGRSALS